MRIMGPAGMSMATNLNGCTCMAIGRSSRTQCLMGRDLLYRGQAWAQAVSETGLCGAAGQLVSVARTIYPLKPPVLRWRMRQGSHRCRTRPRSWSSALAQRGKQRQPCGALGRQRILIQARPFWSRLEMLGEPQMKLMHYCERIVAQCTGLQWLAMQCTSLLQMGAAVSGWHSGRPAQGRLEELKAVRQLRPATAACALRSTPMSLSFNAAIWACVGDPTDALAALGG